MAPRLKVFVTSDGLTDYIVAVSSKPKALAAWGSRKDLFEAGLAHETDEPAVVKAATAQPGEVLRRPAGSRAVLEKSRLAARPNPGSKRAKSQKPSKPPRPEGPSKAHLKRVALAEAKLAAADAAHAESLAALDARRAELDARHEKVRAKLAAALNAARQAPG